MTNDEEEILENLKIFICIRRKSFISPSEGRKLDEGGGSRRLNKGKIFWDVYVPNLKQFLKLIFRNLEHPFQKNQKMTKTEKDRTIIFFSLSF